MLQFYLFAPVPTNVPAVQRTIPAAKPVQPSAEPGLVIILMNRVTPILILVRQGISRVRAVPDIPKLIRRQNPVPAVRPRVLAINARKIMIRMNVNQKKEPIMAKIIGAEQWIISREII